MAKMFIFLNKYWKYLLALLGFVFSSLLAIFFYSLKKIDEKNENSSKKTLFGVIKETNEKITEASHAAELEATVVNTQEAVVKEELKQIQTIVDSAERRKRLVDLYNRVKASS